MDDAELSGKFTVVFHATDPSDAVRARAQHLLTKLGRAYPAIMRGTMVIEGKHRHHQQGNIFHVSLRLHLSEGDVTVSHDPEKNHAHEDVYVSMRDSCDAARRQLDALVERGGGRGARHERKRMNNRPRRPEGLV